MRYYDLFDVHDSILSKMGVFLHHSLHYFLHGAAETAETPAGIGRSVTLADALDDTLQCSTLIDWVKDQNMD